MTARKSGTLRAAIASMLALGACTCAPPPESVTPPDAGSIPDAAVAVEEVAIAPPSVCTRNGVCWRYPAVQGNDLLGIWGSAPTDVWAIGRAGTILHWDGLHWIGATGLAPDELHGIHGSGPTDVWAVGNLGAALHWDGQGWLPAITPDRYELRSVWAADPAHAWAVGKELGKPSEDEEEDEEKEDMAPEKGIILRWNGEEWIVDAAMPKTIPELDEVCGFSASDVWASGQSSGSRAFHWNGKRWSAESKHPGGVALSCGPDGEVWKLNQADGKPPIAIHGRGSHWADAPLPGSAFGGGAGPEARTLWAGADEEVWAFGSPLQMFHRTQGNWATLAFPDAVELHALWSSGPSDAWAVGQAGGILHWNGSAWSPTTDGHRQSWDAIWGSAENDVWISGSSRTLHWNGSDWTESGRPNLIGWSAARNDAWSASGAEIRHWDGTAWSSPVANPSTAGIHALFGTSSTNVWAAGDSATLLHWDGSAWTKTTVAGSSRFTALAGSEAGDVWVGSDDGTIGRWSGEEWKTWNPAGRAQVLAIASNGPNEAWALTSEAPAWQIGARKILKWNGSEWSELPLPTHRGEKVFLKDIRKLANGDLVASSSAALQFWDGDNWHEIPTGAQDGFATLWSHGDVVWMATQSGAVLSVRDVRPPKP